MLSRQQQQQQKVANTKASKTNHLLLCRLEYLGILVARMNWFFTPTKLPAKQTNKQTQIFALAKQNLCPKNNEKNKLTHFLQITTTV